jgi:hypothetical protein
MESLTVLKLMAMVGGFTDFAASNRSTLIRQEGNKKVERRINVRVGRPFCELRPLVFGRGGRMGAARHLTLTSPSMRSSRSSGSAP